MKTLRRLGYLALGIAFAHIVFGAIVRITGSGLGCGDHWPKCHGYWVPPFERLDLIIEVSHRYLALTLSLAVLALAVAALRRRREPGVGGPGGVLRPSALAGVLVLAAALFGALVVKLELTNKYAIVVHLTIAIATLASIALAVLRAGGLGATQAVAGSGSAKTRRGALVAAALAFTAVVLGGLTANVIGANTACIGFPHCARAMAPASQPLWLHLAHRTVAFLLFGHLVGVMVGVARRRESPLLVWAARVAFGTVLLQILVAAALVELDLPPVLKSLHQAVGTLVWLSLFVFAVLAAQASGDAEGALLPPAAPQALPDAGSPHGTLVTAVPVAGASGDLGTSAGGATRAHAATALAGEIREDTALSRAVLDDDAADAHDAAPAPEDDAAHRDAPTAVAIEPEVWSAMTDASAAAFGAGVPAHDAAEGDVPPTAGGASEGEAEVKPPCDGELPARVALSLDDEVAVALEALMATSAVVDVNERDVATHDDEEASRDRDDALAALQAEIAERARVEAMLLEAEAAERVAFEGRAEPVTPLAPVVAGAIADGAPVVPAVAEPSSEPAALEDVSPIPAEVAQLPSRRPPTLAVLIARGADF